MDFKSLLDNIKNILPSKGKVSEDSADISIDVKDSEEVLNADEVEVSSDVGVSSNDTENIEDVSSSPVLKKSKKKKTLSDIDCVVFFEQKEFFDKKFRSSHKKIFGAVTLEEFPYMLYAGENASTLKSDLASYKISLNYFMFILGDIFFRSSKQGVFFSEKEKTLFLFSFGEEDGDVKVKTLVCEESEVSAVAENYFLGKSYIVVDDTEKDLQSLYGKAQTAILALLVLVILGMAYLLWSMLADGEMIKEKPPAPPQPSFRSISLKEKHIMKQQVAHLLFSRFKKEIDAFEDKSKFKIERILEIRLDSVSDIPFLVPIYDEPSNSWKWDEGKEKYKRGGLKATVSIVHQKRYPSEGYTISREGNERKVSFYTKEERVEIEVLTEDIQKDQEPLFLDGACLRATLRLSSEVLVKENTAESLAFLYSDEAPSLFYTQLSQLVSHCPVEIVSFQARANKMTGELFLVKNIYNSSNSTTSLRVENKTANSSIPLSTITTENSENKSVKSSVSEENTSDNTKVVI